MLNLNLFAVHLFMNEAFSNCYDHRPHTLTAKNINTDAPSSTWCRGEFWSFLLFEWLLTSPFPAPGHLEAIATIENIMEHIARKVGKDPLEVRLHNLAEGSELKKILPDFVKSVGE